MHGTKFIIQNEHVVKYITNHVYF